MDTDGETEADGDGDLLEDREGLFEIPAEEGEGEADRDNDGLGDKDGLDDLLNDGETDKDGEWFADNKPSSISA